MTTKQKLRLAAAFVLAFSTFVPSAAQAQRMAGHAVGSAPVRMVSARPMAARAPSFGAAFAGSLSANLRFFAAPGSFRSPGYSRVSGSRGSFGISAATRRRVQFRRPYAGSGFYLLDGGYLIPEEPLAADQESQLVQQPDDEAEQRAPEQAEIPPPAVAAPPDNAPLPDVGQFTLVLRGGAAIQAVGFTRVSDKIVYISTDGSRRTIATADLDAAATKQANEESGNPVLLTL